MVFKENLMVIYTKRKWSNLLKERLLMFSDWFELATSSVPPHGNTLKTKQGLVRWLVQCFLTKAGIVWVADGGRLLWTSSGHRYRPRAGPDKQSFVCRSIFRESPLVCLSTKIMRVYSFVKGVCH